MTLILDSCRGDIPRANKIWFNDNKIKARYPFQARWRNDDENTYTEE
jgi:hypothetical protein